MTEEGRSRHPEQKDDEVFVGNMDGDGFRWLGFYSKRQGTQAYGTDGRPILGDPDDPFSCRPVFVKRKEFEIRRKITRLEGILLTYKK